MKEKRLIARNDLSLENKTEEKMMQKFGYSSTITCCTANFYLK